MNERIRELAKQARDWAEVSYKKQNEQFTSHWDNPIGYTPSQFFEQKFAELIVRECMAMSDELKAQYFTSRKSAMNFDEKNIYAEGEVACDVLKYKMKKHFGIE